jgi:hypothetical protein
VAPRHRDELGAGELGAMQLRQTVDGATRERRRVAMAVPLLVGSGLLQPKGRRQIDDAHAGSQKWFCRGSARVVRQTEENDVAPAAQIGGAGGIERFEHAVAETGDAGGRGDRLLQLLPGALTGRGVGKLEPRVGVDQTNELGAGVAGRTHDTRA